MPQIAKLSDSQFYNRLKNAKGAEGTAELIHTVEKVWDLVSALTKEVSTDFRAYTLHDMTHLGNVIWIMEELIPKTVWEKEWESSNDPLGPMQCTLCLLAALVHDIGMAPSASLRAQLKIVEDLDHPIPDGADREFVAYRRHYASQEDEIRAIRAMREEEKPDEEAILARVHAIRTEYLRLTHADDTISGNSRILTWLNTWMEQDGINFTWNGWPYLDLLERVAISHAHPGGLGELQKHTDYCKRYLKGETFSGLYAAWLLRLADILDLDASRAPSVLYRNFPPDNATSDRHWLQHLSISSRDILPADADRPISVIFNSSGQPCPNPEIRKALQDYCGWIRDEIHTVETSRSDHSLPEDLFPICLPGSDLDADGNPKYITLDRQIQIAGNWNSEAVQFRLSQNDVVKILMGEELYGDPSLCLREVVQNALDATHLRWMRYQLRQKMEEKMPGSYVENRMPAADPSLNKSDLHIDVSWGDGELPDDGWRSENDAAEPETRHWIEIEDHGTGMTHDVVQRFFTQIGKSYYQSAEYRRERALMREFELPVSEISQFGIGILSCFMLADMVEVHTCPIAPNDTDRRRKHYRIWGSDGLFWHKDSTEKTSPGTRIRMWLKREWKSACENLGNLQDELYGYHYKRVSNNSYQANSGRIDPLRAIWSSVAWPRYPIRFASIDHWTLDDSAHLEKLLTFDPNDVGRQFEALTGQPPTSPIELEWRWWDWEHPETASRIRVAVPMRRAIYNNSDTPPKSLNELVDPWVDGMNDTVDVPTKFLPAITENSLPTHGRTSCLVRGIRVHDLMSLESKVPIAHNVGTICIVDLSGHAAPRLRADRKASTNTQRTDWRAEIDQLFHQWKLDAFRDLSSPEIIRVAIGLISVKGETRYPSLRESLEKSCRWEVGASEVDLFSSLLKQEQAVDKFRDPDLKLASDRSLVPLISISNESNVALNLAKGFFRRLDFVTEGISPNSVAKYEALVRNLYRGRFRDLDCPPFHDRKEITRSWGWFRKHYVVPELFGPSLDRAFPMIEAPIAKGSSSHARLIAPTSLEFQWQEQDTRTPPPVTAQFRSGWATSSTFLNNYNYDLVSPMTQIPLGNLREACPAWQTERHVRVVLLLPFFYSGTIGQSYFKYCIQFLQQRDQFAPSRIRYIHMLIPDAELYDIPFSEWTEQGMSDRVTTAALSTQTGTVVWARGFHDHRSIIETGETLEQIAKIE